ncbi:hypothetical protein BUALT_BualtUnG0033000 [Buddleja alternifolia]|uniref:Protein FAR1-RELATED SEQUENCE n=1 Tax=Buddleja alternifolia TaxID=168488 RepID=A0AAV6VZ14_9LAMI|nr:hypothetical protein BUALT_BualtUnG0033000 [Buddleja alternifolia]
MDEISLNGEPAYDDEAEDFEIEGECAMTEYVGQTGNILHGDNPLAPAVGMEFESYDDVYYFYNCCAKQQGFGVRVSNTWYRKSKERYRAKLSCSSAGFKKKSEANRPRPETRTGCPAMIKFRLMENKRWRIIEVELEHNHLTNPTSVVIDAEDNGILNFDEGELRNNVNKLKLKRGDAQEMFYFFTMMQLRDPSFFYVMDINEQGHLRNIFWADTKCRATYGYFGDVIFIDTTNLIEKYEVPLVVFGGINHHAQTVLLGCGLVSGQTVDSFIWLLRAWLTYMVGRTPQTVVTNQCKSLQTSISEVFPRAFHCLSLTNIMKKVPEELVGLEEFDAIKMAFTRAVYRSLRVDEFEAAWEEMVHTHGLIDHNWLQILYEDRKRWVPVYLKDVFLAGIFPAKENEKLTSPFEEYLNENTTLREFFHIYDKALLELDQRETCSDIESRNPGLMLKSRFYFELQLSKLYANDIVKKFQDEIEGMYTCFSVRPMNINGSVSTFIVKEETWDYEVIHALSIIDHIGLEEIPPQYVLARWRKDIKRSYSFNYGWNGIDINNPVHRYDNLYKCVVKVVEEGRKSRDCYKYVLKALDEILNKVRIQEDYPANSM